MPDFPSWVNVSPRDFLRATEAGNQAGLQTRQIANQAAEASARLTQEQQIATMQAEARKQIVQQNALRQQAQIENLKAYREAQVGLAKGRLDEQTAIAHAKAAEQAKKFAAQQKFAGLLQKGMSPQEALYQVPELSTPSAVASMGRGAGTRDYGDIQTMQGPSGSSILYRRGSPGLHVVNPKKSIDERMFDIQAAKYAEEIAKYEAANYPEGVKRAQDALEKLRSDYEAKEAGTTQTGTYKPGGSKVERARQLHQEHPDWDKQTIIEAVNKEFGGAPQ